jgi:protein-S-isoprenylcysteine O-methyltransferase Ste14
MVGKPHDHPEINRNIHPPIVALAHIAIAFLLGYLMPLSFTPISLLPYTGLAIAFIGFLMGFAAFNEFGKANTTLDPHGSATQVVTSGIYRFTRNPIYLGFLLMIIGFPLVSGSYWGMVMAPFFIATMNRLVIGKEEAHLEKKFGEAYTSYKSRVRRWL